ncbi:MAG: hypothetical protein PUB67_03220 [Clostridiales bacterium]|nr:hypothetical protein [Clostridiales bacterium]
MKRHISKIILLLLMIGAFCVLFTGCDNEMPTNANIYNALDSNGCFIWRRVSIDGNEEKNVSTYKIDERKTFSNDHVQYLVTVTTPYDCVTEDVRYALEFKRQDSKWNCTSVMTLEPPSNGSNIKLVKKISYSNIKSALKGISYNLPNGMFIDYSTLYKLVITEHKLDALGYSDRVTITFSANIDRKKYEFTGDVFFAYTYNQQEKKGTWKFINASIDEFVRSDISDTYRFSPTRGELYWIFKDSNDSIPMMTSYYALNKGKITNYSYSNIEQDGSDFLKVPSTFTFDIDKFNMDVSCDIYYYFNNQGWKIDHISNVMVTRLKSPIIGIYEGTAPDGRKYSIEFTDKMDSNSRIIVHVTCQEGDETYKYDSYVYSYKEKDEKINIRVDFSEWIQKPANGDEYRYEDFVGVIDGNNWEIVGQKRWNAKRNQ